MEFVVGLVFVVAVAAVVALGIRAAKKDSSDEHDSVTPGLPGSGKPPHHR